MVASLVQMAPRDGPGQVDAYTFRINTVLYYRLLYLSLVAMRIQSSRLQPSTIRLALATRLHQARLGKMGPEH